MIKSKSFYIFFIIIFILTFITIVPNYTYGDSEKNPIEGKIYLLDSKKDFNNFEDMNYNSSLNEDSYGDFTISGDIVNISQKGNIPMYEIEKDNITLFYNYDDELLNDEETNWHLKENNSKKILSKKYNDKIKKGAILVQVSSDGKNWSDKKYISNAFNDVPIRTDSIYTSEDVELLNGCYYRVIIAYELERKIEPSKVLFITKDNYETKRIVELYEFYALYSNTLKEDTPDQKYRLGNVVRTKDFDGYKGETEINKSDPHYGWDLGNFYVKGYTDKIPNKNGDPVFLKNVGDKVALVFELNQDINKLNNNEHLKISADPSGYDQYFGTETINFGRGTLFIRYTDNNNNTEKPTIYTNYLEANTVLNAETKVQLFEEGDYEVALDYEITNDKLIDKVRHYRIFFKFSVRNGNCMVYPIDLVTGNELTNSSITENGFKLDLAKSKYLNINVKKENWVEGAEGFVEDTRFNTLAKDGAEYKDEGIYTITANNESTNQITSKKIYVGTNNILKAYMTSGLSIKEINNLVNEGAEIGDDGSITINKELLNNNSINKQKKNEQTSSSNHNLSFIFIIVIILIFLISLISLSKRKIKKDTGISKKNHMHIQKNEPEKTIEKTESIINEDENPPEKTSQEE